MRLASWLKEQGLAVLAMALILAVCIPIFLLTLAEQVSGPAAPVSSSLAYYDNPAISSGPPESRRQSVANASRVTPAAVYFEQDN